MADNQAAASLPPVSKDKEKVSPPLPVVPVPAAPVDDDKIVKQMAVLVDVDVKPASSLSISPPLAVMPADKKKKTTTTTTPPAVAVPILFVVCLWALVNAVVFAIADVATLIVNRTPCTKSTWLFRCVTLTDAAAAEVSLLHMPLHMAWVALAATAGIHCMEVAYDRIFLAADAGDTYIFVDVVLSSIYVAVDLLAGVLLCCSPRRLELGEQKGDDDGEV